jgi:hypothetical protein
VCVSGKRSTGHDDTSESSTSTLQRNVKVPIRVWFIIILAEMGYAVDDVKHHLKNFNIVLYSLIYYTFTPSIFNVINIIVLLYSERTCSRVTMELMGKELYSISPGSQRSEGDLVEVQSHIKSVYMWHEAAAKPGANQTVSCLCRYVQSLPSNVTHLGHCSYNCMGEDEFFLRSFCAQCLLKNPYKSPAVR